MPTLVHVCRILGQICEHFFYLNVTALKKKGGIREFQTLKCYFDFVLIANRSSIDDMVNEEFVDTKNTKSSDILASPLLWRYHNQISVDLFFNEMQNKIGDNQRGRATFPMLQIIQEKVKLKLVIFSVLTMLY